MAEDRSGEPSGADSAQQMIADGILLISTEVQGMWVNTARAYLSELQGGGSR